MMKNMDPKKVVKLADSIEYLPGQITSKTLAQNEHHSLTLFAFEKGEEISSHKSGGDAFVLALEGEGKITIDDDEMIVKAGEAVIMPAGHPHAVYATERFKMSLTVLFD